MHRRPLLFSFCLLIGFFVQATAAANPTAGEAKNHIGENATVWTKTKFFVGGSLR